MLASRVLPPILRSPPPPPVATFFNIPRRYVKSNMNVGEDASRSPMEDVRSSRNLRKSNRAHDMRSSSISSQGQHANDEQLPSPAVSSPRATKKRLVSLDDLAGDSNDEDHLMSHTRKSSADISVSSAGSVDSSGHVCLCQPEPKIPRPRNAFILYRQHHQHSIVASNPGLANPEISKIIGEQWKSETEVQKKIWQDLAQEEKARHHELYPDYRYQPRRLGKPGALPLNPSGQHTTVEKYRCPRCGGRSIKTPTSPFVTAGTPTLPLPNVSEGLTPTTQYLPMMSNMSLESPVARRRVPGHSSLSHLQVPISAREETGMYSPLTPDSKRRRYNHQYSSAGRRSEGSYDGHARRESLPPIQVRTSPSSTGSMPPPRTPRDLRRGSLDLNVLVANQHDQSRSVEAMVMSVPFMVKVKVLGRITPPLKEPGPASPSLQVRGAIIAIEGDDLDAVKELTEWLNDHLTTSLPECRPRIFDPPQAPSEDDKDVTFENYLDLITEWHGKSREMVKYITTPVSPSPSDSDMDATSDANDNDSGKDSPTPSSSAAATSKLAKPVIILPTYQLHASDVYTSKIPIQDAYSPTDHWQWMATLWRGTVGPDLTIYVRNHEAGAKDGQGNSRLVEVNDEVRCLTVQRGKEGKVEASALRRVGFEVGEWINSTGGSANGA